MSEWKDVNGKTVRVGDLCLVVTVMGAKYWRFLGRQTKVIGACPACYDPPKGITKSEIAEVDLGLPPPEGLGTLTRPHVALMLLSGGEVLERETEELGVAAK